ncbi:MAG: PD-(D/E)XK nuclease family protein, partial [Clostridia bacterium]|nr:PD-(D/E)XK nuclease family protein [Clostridia bacterium]
SDGGDGETIFMSENFRCSEPVIDFVNAVSRYMFPYGQIPFEEGDLLVHGRSEIEGAEMSPVEVCLVERPDKRTVKKNLSEDGGTDPNEDIVIPPSFVVECEYIARRIRHMLDFETLPDKTPIRPKDIAVMYRMGKERIGVLVEALEKYNIPITDMEKKHLFKYPEVQLLLCILKAVDNPSRELYLTGAMYSSLFGFTLGDMATLKTLYKNDVDKGSLWEAVRYAASNPEKISSDLLQKCTVLIDTLAEYRALSETLPSHAFVYRLIHTPAVACAIEDEGGAGAIDRAMQFYELARGRDLSLYDFLIYADHVEKRKMEDSEKGGGDGVSIITIHHSKGLEFPVCFLMSAQKRYSTKDLEKSMFLDRSFGVAMKLPDESGLVNCDNVLRRLAMFRTERENAFEEMRLLYVAMTRARERLIITGTTNSPEKLLGRAFMNAKYSGRYTVLAKNNYLDMILEALNLYGGRFASVVTVPYSLNEDEICEVLGDDTEGITDAASEDTVSAEELADKLRERIDFRYPHEHLENIPSKLTVSKLYPEILDEFDDGASELEEDDVAEPSVPKFMLGTKYSPTDAGSAAHVFLQFCDFERLRDLGVEAELSRLIAEGYISKSDGEAANREYIEAFRRSEFFGRVLLAKEVRREFRFNAAVPAATLTGDAEKSALLEKDGTDVIVQGVIDIVFTDADGRLVLADYKTDRLTSYELEHKSAAADKLWARHKRQLGYYAAVCEKIFGRAPDEVVIYSMPLGETV